MRIAIPVASGRLSAHFGHCERFALIDIDPATRTVLRRRDIAAPPHQPGLLPEWLAEQQVRVVIAAGMGERAQTLCRDKGIEVIVGAAAETPEHVLTQYLQGALEVGENRCDH